jgi:hypothetical protein
MVNIFRLLIAIISLNIFTISIRVAIFMAIKYSQPRTWISHEAPYIVFER